MEYVLTPYSTKLVDIAWWDNAFTEEELNFLQNIAKNANVESQVGNGQVNKDIRKSKHIWVNNNPDTFWIFNKLGVIISKVNASFFNFDLTGFGEALQVTNYESNNLGEYNWHIDNGSNSPCRKLSLSIQLSHPYEYEDGFLEIRDREDTVHTIPKKRGYISLFPSFLRHRVTPVTSGSRQSLVAWISGPNFK